jgi:rubrerythrin
MENLVFDSIEDILQYAIDEEESAGLFYEEQARKCVKIELRTIWQQLSNDEIRHKAILSDILQEIKNEGHFNFKSMDLNQLPDHQTVEIDDSSFDETRKVFLEAMKNENDAYFMYKNLALKMPNENHQKVLIVLASEELKHKDALLKELNM